MSEDRYVHSDEARRKFRRLLNEVEHDGAHVTILRYETPAAVIVPFEWHRTVMAEIEARSSASQPGDGTGAD